MDVRKGLMGEGDSAWRRVTVHGGGEKGLKSITNPYTLSNPAPSMPIMAISVSQIY